MTTRNASIALVVGGMLWGLYWIPVRMFHALGLEGALPGIVMYSGALLALAPLLWANRSTLLLQWRMLAFSGMFTGAAFSLFTTSLVYTDVVRSILLFYLTPIWGTVLGIAVLEERLSTACAAGLLAGLAGLVIVLGGNGQVPWPRNTGDWLALFSGMAWALGTLGLYRAQQPNVIAQIGAFLVGALLISVLSICIHGGLSVPSIGLALTWPILPLATLSVVYIMPMIFLTIWHATLLSPAKVGLLLMSEVVVGLISAALFAGEAFGVREALGALLIVSAALIEILAD